MLEQTQLPSTTQSLLDDVSSPLAFAMPPGEPPPDRTPLPVGAGGGKGSNDAAM